MDASHRVHFSWLSDLHTGASELARRHVGTPVFGGMIFASFVGIFAIPALYVLFQAIRERLRPGAQSWKVRR
jgi:hypothetical protein